MSSTPRLVPRLDLSSGAPTSPESAHRAGVRSAAQTDRPRLDSGTGRRKPHFERRVPAAQEQTMRKLPSDAPQTARPPSHGRPKRRSNQDSPTNAAPDAPLPAREDKPNIADSAFNVFLTNPRGLYGEHLDLGDVADYAGEATVKDQLRTLQQSDIDALDTLVVKLRKRYDELRTLCKTRAQKLTTVQKQLGALEKASTAEHKGLGTQKSKLAEQAKIANDKLNNAGGRLGTEQQRAEVCSKRYGMFVCVV